MTAVAEARALLDQLMGGDRNAPLPSGAALPQKRKGDASHGGALLLPGKRAKSCYDKDIDPLFCAWGVDVYELFVNTKSDIGPNPYKPDEDARLEFQALPQSEKDRLGFEHRLFRKLADLVQSCDRTIQRNQEKLNKELNRQQHARGGHDYVLDVDEAAVAQLCRNQITLEQMTADLEKALARLTEIKQREETLLAKAAKESESSSPADESSTDKPPVKKEEAPSETPDGEITSDTPAADGAALPIKQESEEPAAPPPSEQPAESTPSPEALELGAILLEKQALVVDLANLVSQVSPLQETVETQERNLNHVKSDITTDKTVCEVSGNFMSSRDADERIAAHFAGKQYVGWKLVRDKYTQLIQQYGKYGPPPPPRGPPPGGDVGGGGPPMMYPPRGGGPGGNYHGGPPRRDGGGGGGGGRRDHGGRWERGSTGSGGSGGGGGRYDRGGGGGYDRGGRRGGGGDSYQQRGGWGRR